MEVDGYVILAGPPKPADFSLYSRDSPEPRLSSLIEDAAWCDHLDNADNTARRLVRAMHIALVSQGALNVVVHQGASTTVCDDIITAVSPLGAKGPAPSSPMKHSRTKVSAFSPNEPFKSPNTVLNGIEEVFDGAEDQEAVRSNVLQYVRALAGLSMDARVIATLVCSDETSERDIYDAFSAALLQSQRPPADTAERKTTSPMPEPLVSANVTPADATAAATRSPINGAAEAKDNTESQNMNTTTRLQLTKVSSIADTIARGVASVARLAGNYLHAPTLETPQKNIAITSESHPQTGSAQTAQAHTPTAMAPPSELRVLILDHLNLCRSGVQDLVAEILRSKKLPKAALLQYYASLHNTSASTTVSSTTGSQVGDPRLGPWQALVSDKGENAHILTSSLSLTSSTAIDTGVDSSELPWDTRCPFSTAKVGATAVAGLPSAGVWPLSPATLSGRSRVSSFAANALSRRSAMERVSGVGGLHRAAQSFLEVPGCHEDASLHMAAACLTPVAGLESKYLIETGLVPPAAIGAPDVLPGVTPHEVIVLSPRGAIPLETYAKEEDAWVSLPPGFIVILLSDAPSSKRESVDEVWDNLLNAFARDVAASLGAEEQLLNQALPLRTPPEVQVGLTQRVANTMMLHVPVSAAIAAADVERAASMGALSSPVPASPPKHGRYQSAGQQSQSSHVSELFSPRRGMEIAVAFARSEKKAWMKRIMDGEFTRFVDNKSGVNGIVSSEGILDAIDECVNKVKQTPYYYSESLSLAFDAADAIDGSISGLVEQLSREPDGTTEPAQALAEYRVLLSRILPAPSTIKKLVGYCLQSDRLRDHVIMAVKAHAGLEGRPYVTIDDLHAVLWSCLSPVYPPNSNP